MAKKKRCDKCQNLEYKRHRDGTETVFCKKLGRQLKWHYRIVVTSYKMEKSDAFSEC